METNEIDDFVEHIRNGFKYNNEEEFNYDLIINSTSDSLKKLLKKEEKNIQFVNSHPDSKKRFEIAMNLLGRLENKKSFDITDQVPENSFLAAKQAIQNMDPVLVDFDRFRESSDIELEKNAEAAKDAFCKTYAFLFEDNCKSFFKLFARIIKNKKISECAICIDIINKYEPAMNFITQDFMPQVRNSIKHEDAYYDHSNHVVMFPNRDKTPIAMVLSDLRQGCRILMVNKVCMDAACNNKRMPELKVSEYYFQKTEEYCKLLQLDFKHVLRYTMEKGLNLLYVYNILEKKIQNQWKCKITELADYGIYLQIIGIVLALGPTKYYIAIRVFELYLIINRNKIITITENRPAKTFQEKLQEFIMKLEALKKTWWGYWWIKL